MAKRGSAIRSLINASIWLFIITAAVGVWSSYEQVSALRFFLLTLLSGVLFYFLAKSPKRNLWKVPLILSVYGVILVWLFLLTQDWGLHKADIELINRIGLWWMAIRPDVPFNPPHQNMVAGTLSIIIPLDLVWLIREKDRSNRQLLTLTIVNVSFLSFGLWLSSSRGAWLSLLAGLGVGAVLARFGKTLGRSIHLNKRGHWEFLGWYPKSGTSHRVSQRADKRLVWTGLLLAIFVFSLLAAAGANRLLDSQGISSNGNSLESRLTLYRNSIDLVKDQWLIGGGLGSFSGLYSSYLLLLPVPIYFYSHNLYLDIWIEQGIFGIIAWLIVLAGSFLLCVRYLMYKAGPEQDGRLLSAGILASLVTLSLHGLIDNPIYAEWGRLMLFVLPGLAVAATGLDSIKGQTVRITATESSQKQKNFALLALIVAIATILWFNKVIGSAWYANIGSIVMAKTQLLEWPSGQWPEKSMGDQLTSAKPLFEKSLNIQTSNSTSNYRLGLIEFYAQDFSSAEQYLSKAYQLNDYHRGIQKALGYTSIWLGKFDQAKVLLRAIPEARAELDVYTWWWTTQDRGDLAENAEKMIGHFDRESSTSTGND